MSSLAFFLLGACAPMKYFEYPEGNESWFPSGIAEELESQNVVPVQKDAHTDVYSLNHAMNLATSGMTLKNISMSQIQKSIWVEDRSDCSEIENDTGSNCDQHESGHIEDYTLSSMNFFYNYNEGLNCRIDINRVATLQDSNPSDWQFREYPDNPAYSDINTCSSILSDELAIQDINEIIFGDE